MNDIAKTAALIALGGIVGGAGFALMTHEAPAEAATPVAAAPAPTTGRTPSTPPREDKPTPVLDVSYTTTGAVESGAPTRAYAVFVVSSTDDVADVELVVTGGVGANPVEAVGDEFETSGDSLNVDLGELPASGQREVVVAFSVSGDNGAFDTHTSYRDLHTGRTETVTGASARHTISRKLRRPKVYERVLSAQSEEAIAFARKFRDQERYDDALDWIDQTYTTNVEVGITMRLSGALSGYQKTLSDLREEIEILAQPKPKHRVHKEERKIELICGDNKRCKNLKKNDIYIN